MKIAAIAHKLPSRRVENEELLQIVMQKAADHLNKPHMLQLSEKVRGYFEQTGIRSRYWRSENEKALTLGLEAAQQALDEARIRAEDVDLLIYVGVGRGWLEPAMANLFLAELGMRRGTGFDLLDACASWVRALDIAGSLIENGKGKAFCCASFEREDRISERSVEVRLKS